jgi:hypothetical protein
MSLCTDPDNMTPDARHDEIAALFARGLLRLRVRPALQITDPGNEECGLAILSDSRPDGLLVNGTRDAENGGE